MMGRARAPDNDAMPPASLQFLIIIDQHSMPSLKHFSILATRTSAASAPQGIDSPTNDMTPCIRQYTVRWPCQCRSYTQLVPHGAAHDEQARFLARHVCYIGFQGIGGRVFLEDVVLKGAVLSREQHGEGWTCDGIAWRGCQLCWIGEHGLGEFEERTSGGMGRRAHCGSQRLLIPWWTMHSAHCQRTTML